MEVQLTALHYIYLIGVLAVMGIMIARRDTLIPCILAIFAIGVVAKGSIFGGLAVIFNALIAAGTEFLPIITIIALVVALSKGLADLGSDYILMSPLAKAMKNPDIAFWATGLGMLIVSLFVWPSPAVALIGAILLPVAVRAGLPAIGAAVAMNLFGHGIGLSTDFIIQGAPGLTAQFAGLPDASHVILPGIPLYLTMSIVTVVTAYVMLKKDLAANKDVFAKEALAYQDTAASSEARTYSPVAKFVAILVPIAFIIDVIAMLKFDLKGGDASALIGGTALAIITLGAILEYKLEALEKITDYVRDGFGFGMKVFAPVIVIGAFFFLGSEDTAKAILDESATGLLMDWAKWLSNTVPLSAIPVAFIQLVVGGITGLDGSGFSGLPLVGSMAKTFGTAINANVGVLSALGQISAIWVGGGTIIPWGLIPVAAICGVEPMELVRRNFIPVMLGFAATLIVAIFLL